MPPVPRPPRLPALLAALHALLLMLLLAACGPTGDVRQPIPTAVIPAPQPATRAVVVLPGRGDDLAALRRAGIAQAVHAAWPDADVILAELAIAYYMDGNGPKRLHDEVIAPAKARGYRELWLGGASMGGMGTLLYDRAYPGSADGLVLLAPYLGDRPILQQITQAGGIAAWDPGPPQPIGPDNWQHELWRHLQGWAKDPAKARNVWLAYGDRDRLRRAMPVIQPLLRSDQVLVRDGGHAWTVWTPALREVLEGVERQRRQAAR